MGFVVDVDDFPAPATRAVVPGPAEEWADPESEHPASNEAKAKPSRTVAMTGPRTRHKVRFMRSIVALTSPAVV
jgi:hypothetical protein